MIFGFGIICYGKIDVLMMVVYDVVLMLYEFVGIDLNKLLVKKLVLLMIGVSFKCYFIGEVQELLCGNYGVELYYQVVWVDGEWKL